MAKVQHFRQDGKGDNVLDSSLLPIAIGEEC